MQSEQTRHEATPPGRRPLKVAALGLSSAAAIGLLVGATQIQATDPQPAASSAAAWPGYADLVEQVMPSVVGIRAEREAPEMMAQRSPREFEDPEEFRRFFEEGPGSEMFERFMERFFGEQMPFPEAPREFARPQAMGSGFIVDDDGVIVTNNHVVAGASKVTVILHDGTELEGDVIGRDPATDLAVVRVDTDKDLQPVAFADSDEVRVGDPVIAIGSPFGLGGTVTAGIVSADNRVIGAGRYDNFLQIDAAINRGNSGGPAFNLEGEVIGVNTAIHSPTGGNVGIGFAIPANLAVEVIEDLRDDGVVERGWLGVQIQGLDEDLARSLGLDEPRGALVAEVLPGTPAEAAGFAQGDVVLSFEGEEVEDVRDLTRMVGDADPGESAEVVVWRDGNERTFEVELGQLPSGDRMAALPDEEAEDEDTPKLGVALARLTDERRESLDLPADAQGVVVTEVQPGSPAAEKGLRRGDLIVEAGRRPVTSPKEVGEAVREAAEQGKDTILLLVQRDGQNRFMAVPLARA